MSGPEPARALGHVLWIDGSVYAGKTSAAVALAEQSRLQRYHFDDFGRLHFDQSRQRVPPAEFPIIRPRLRPTWYSRTPASGKLSIMSYEVPRGPYLSIVPSHRIAERGELEERTDGGRRKVSPGAYWSAVGVKVAIEKSLAAT